MRLPDPDFGAWRRSHGDCAACSGSAVEVPVVNSEHGRDVAGVDLLIYTGHGCTAPWMTYAALWAVQVRVAGLPCAWLYTSPQAVGSRVDERCAHLRHRGFLGFVTPQALVLHPLDRPTFDRALVDAVFGDPRAFDIARRVRR